MNIIQLLTTYNTFLAIACLIVLLDGLVLLSDRMNPWIPDRARSLLVKIMPAYIVIIALGAIGGPLLYQYYFAFPPCMLCWYQRIFLWPALILAIWSIIDKNFKSVSKYIVGLSIISLIIGINHYLLQFGMAPSAIPCDAVGQSVSCEGIDVIVFNFVTIPFMAVAANIGLIGSVLWLSKNK